MPGIVLTIGIVIALVLRFSSDPPRPSEAGKLDPEVERLREELHLAQTEARGLAEATREARDETEMLRDEAETLPSAAAIAERTAAALAQRRARVLATVLVALSLGASHGLVEWLSKGSEPIVVYLGPTDPRKLRREIDRTRPALVRAREQLAQARFGSLPSLPPAAPGERSYPGLHRLGAVLRAESEDAWRWANVAVAACTVDETDLARWALGVLRSRAPRGDEAPTEPPSGDLRLAIGAVHLECRARGHSLLEVPVFAEPE